MSEVTTIAEQVQQQLQQYISEQNATPDHSLQQTLTKFNTNLIQLSEHKSK